MKQSNIILGNASTLINDSNESLEEISKLVKTINNIYDTFDALATSWTGQKANEYKKIIEEARNPLKEICRNFEDKNQSLNNVGNLISNYQRK